MGIASLTDDIDRLPPRATLFVEKLVRSEAVLFLVIILVAAGFRFAAIGAKSFWFDEAYSAHVASESPHDLVNRIQTEDTHPPMYYLLLSAWGRLVGTGDIPLRSLSATVSVFTVAGAWWIGRRLGGTAIGAIAAFITATSAFQVLAAQEARMYALLGFLTIVSWAALLAACEYRRGAWALYVIATTLALYTHYFAFLTVVGQGLYVFAAVPPSRRAWSISLLATGALYAPWIGTLIATFISGRGWPFIRPPFGAAQETQLLDLIGFGGHAFGSAGWHGGWPTPLRDTALALPFWIFALIGGYALRNQRRTLGFLTSYLLIPIVLASIFSFRHNVFYPRYFSFIYPPFALLSAFGIIAVANHVPERMRRAIVLMAALLILVPSGLALQASYTEGRFDPYNWRRVVATVTAEAGPSDLIVVTPEFGHIPFSRYFRGPQRVISMTPTELTIPVSPTPQELQEMQRLQQPPLPPSRRSTRPQFQEYARDHEVMWLVVTIPFPREAAIRLGGLLKGIYDPVQIGDFGSGITLFKMKRHQPDS